MLILGGPCAPQGQVRHVADLFRQIRHGNRNKTAKCVLNRLYFVGGGPKVGPALGKGGELGSLD